MLFRLLCLTPQTCSYSFTTTVKTRNISVSHQTTCVHHFNVSHQKQLKAYQFLSRKATHVPQTHDTATILRLSDKSSFKKHNLLIIKNKVHYITNKCVAEEKMISLYIKLMCKETFSFSRFQIWFTIPACFVRKTILEQELQRS